ncbi:hypothetical protein K2Z84_01985 [Candidatus Binatia bacterium]|nr:hypothetical protein [Candidatus Binatia bacterium]
MNAAHGAALHWTSGNGATRDDGAQARTGDQSRTPASLRSRTARNESPEPSAARKPARVDAR